MKTFKQFLLELNVYRDDWGFIDPEGNVISGPEEGLGFDAIGGSATHWKLAKKLGFEDEKEAISNGYIRFSMDDKTVFFHFHNKANGRIFDFLKDFPSLKDIIIDDGRNNFGFSSKSGHYTRDEVFGELRNVI